MSIRSLPRAFSALPFPAPKRARVRVRDVFYDCFDDERAARPVSKTPPARLAARRKLLDSSRRNRQC